MVKSDYDMEENNSISIKTVEDEKVDEASLIVNAEDKTEHEKSTTQSDEESLVVYKEDKADHEKSATQSDEEEEEEEEKEEKGFLCSWVTMQTGEHPQNSQQLVLHNSGSMSFSSNFSREDEEMSRSALSTFRAKEEEIEKKRMEVREKVQAHMGRVEEETKRLATIREELEALGDPTRKEVASVRKKIDSVNKELKPLGHSCQKKEKEYKDALEAYNEKNKEKVQLIARLMELVSESERLRMKKLEELSKNIDSLQ